MLNSFHSIYKLIRKHPKTALFLVILFFLSSYFIIKHIQFNEDIYKVIPSDDNIATATEILQKMSFTDKITVIFQKKDSTSQEELTDAAEAFMDTILSCSEYYHNIQGIMDPEFFNKAFRLVYNHLPIYLDTADYHEIEKKIHPDSIRQQIERNYQLLMGSQAFFMKDIIVQDPLLLSFLALQKLRKFQGGDDFIFENGYLFSQDKSKIFLFINPKYGGAETKNNEVFVERLNEIQEFIQHEYPSIKLSYFGSAFIAVANAQQIKQDIIITISISVGLLMLLLIFYYRNWMVPVLVMIPTVFGGLTGILCLALLRPNISAISLSVSAILIGITIDYALHFLTHSKGSINQEELFRDVSKPLLMSSTTTAIAFLCLLFVRSEALIDLGIFASIAVVSSAIFTLILLPHIYKGSQITHTHLIDRIARYPFEKNKLLIGLSILLIVVSFFTWQKVNFDGDLSRINYMPQEQLETEKSMHSHNEVLKRLFIVAYGDEEHKVQEQNQQILSWLKKHEDVVQVQSINDIIPDENQQKEALSRWNEFWTHARKVQTIQTIEHESNKKGFIEHTHQPFFQALNQTYTTITLDTLKAFDVSLYNEFVHGDENLRILSTLIQLKPENRASFSSSFTEIQHTTNALILDRQALNEQYLGYLIDDFNKLVGYSFIAVLLILLAFYKRIELVLVASIPIALTGFITTGMMGLLQIDFNIFSMIVCTLVFGHGIDFTIFMTNALLKEYTTGKDETPVYRTSIILAVLTTVLAIGALIFAKHPALRSISSVALVGVTVAVLITFVLYPLLFRFLFFRRIKKGLSPINLQLLLQGLLLFTFFSVASLFTSFVIRFILRFLPLSEQRKMALATRYIARYMNATLYLQPGVRKPSYPSHLLPPDKPFILIANHSSFIDTLTITLLHRKIVFLVNDWVFNSPIFGSAVRYMGFIPVSSGLENHMENIQQKITHNFSIATFPEGTRSKTSEIHRFHKGAIFLAAQLNLPIVPVYLHGNAEVMPKGDFIAYNGMLNVHVGEAIEPQDDTFGKTVSERTRRISQHFKKTFTEIRLQNEDENYFYQKLLLNYLYKEGNLIRHIKSDFQKNKHLYYKLFKDVPPKAHIAHITDDFGQVDFLLVHQFASRKVTTFNLIESHRDISRASYIVYKFRVNYVDQIEQLWNGQDVLLISKINLSDIKIPPHIQKIIVLQANISEKFIGFSIVREESNYVIYQRNEKDETI